MTYRAASIPQHAEALELDAAVKVERKPSRLAPPAQQLVTRLHCPACEKVIAEMTLHPVRCSCGLWLKVDDTRAWIWRDRPDRKPALVTTSAIFALIFAGALVTLALSKVEPSAAAAPMPAKDQVRLVGGRG